MSIQNLTLNEIVLRYPGSRMVFETFHLDYCCGGKQTLEHACQKKNIAVADIEKAIEKEANKRDDEIRFEDWPLDLLVDYIEKKHHRYTVDTLGLLAQKLERLVQRHGEENPYLMELQEVFLQMAGNLSMHMKKEEMMLFPAVRNILKAKMSGAIWESPVSLASAVAQMEHEHEEEGIRLTKMAEITNQFTPPEHACATWQFTYDKLAEFEKDLHRHIFLENGILFPAAIQMESEQVQPQSCMLR